MRPFTPISRHRSGPPPRTATPIKSILRPSVLGRRKADEAGLDSVAADPPSSPTKRRKVFINEMNNRVFEFGGRSMDEVNAEVRKALEEHLMGEDEEYDNLKEIFANDKQRYLPPVAGEEEDTLKPQELKCYVLALTSCVPLLKNKACNGLVRTVLQVSWLGRDEDFFKVYIQFLAALISAQGSYLTHVLSMIVEKFCHSRQSEWGVGDFPPVSRSTMRERLHTGLQYLLQMFPAATPVLRNLLDTKFPFDDDPKRMFVSYVINLLKLSDYAGELDLDIIDVLLSRLVKIDVQMQTDLDDLDDDLTASVAYALGKSLNTGSWEGDEEAEEEDSDDESVDSDDSDFDDKEEKIRIVKCNVEKLDAILDTLFDHYTPLFENPDSDEAWGRYALLVQSFGKIVLPTYKSRHTQFLLFHFGQMSARLRDTFVGSLMHIFGSQNRPSFVRQAAATYLAGFMARGAHVPPDLVRTVFALLLKQMQIYRVKHDPDARGPDLRRHQIYYAQVQAALYMFCFRWRDLIVDTPEFVDRDDPASYLGNELEWMQGMREELSASVYCKMNPLKICAPAIVEEFATLAHKLGLMYIFPRVEENKRIRLSQFVSDTYGTGGALRDTGSGAQDEESYQLDPYFPFDPYQLPVSKRWIQGDYVQYQAIPGLNMEAGDDDSDEEEDDVPETDVEEDTATASEDEDDD
ncbi:RNA polymerase I-specific transcription initiation factor RRN3 [Colletotrichum gloeosporioides]|uniref:RNA polymerase I specific transcription initiation factor RRN3 n=2 Tax=Colletotrichum gloeosporioides TaxID=474922 RepID=T0KXZ2_COLGC|nr:RNA polymerase I-specific transcription initiation factor RRN3 [Colletotrichum gloeosporioides]EQB57333.1 RNA polymerase I specific transcription initiation factor RRN3 [Colletotrichum gloeosporioides Cg-14]KAF3812065.1 RNA polymerase I-specific transcription initiation factor RRN3 [Colletotrichum gloeosporioides]